MPQTADLRPRDRRSTRILVAEDAQGDLLLLREAFRSRAPHVSLHTLPDGVALLRRLAAEEPLPAAAQARLLVLDASLPRLDVRALVMALRALSVPPLVLVLACDAGKADRLASLGSLAARVQVRPVYYGQWLALVEGLMPAIEVRLAASDIRPPAPRSREDPSLP
jgi:CheY-like chemotaxis protein